MSEQLNKLNLSQKIQKKKKREQEIMFWMFRLFSLSIILILFAVLAFIIYNGFSSLNWKFISGMPEEGMTKGGIFPAIIGTIYLTVGSMLFAVPVGIMSGIYLNEYMKDGWIKKIINQMTNNLAGVPSIVFGLFGMTLFVNKLEFGDSILAGSLTLGILVLPVIIRTTEEALKTVDNSIRVGSMALGASKLQTIRKLTFPIAFPNIITGIIISVGRVSGETAPILFTVAAYFLPRLPHSIFDQVMALPYHLYVISTSGTNIEESRPIAYGTALVLVLMVLILNLTANFLRKIFGKKVKMN